MAKARILAVDDQLYFRTFIEGLLVEEGYEVRTASSGAEALRAAERERFDVVITDLVMPEMDGRELVRRLKERDRDQDTVVLTGVGDVKTAVDAMKVGATDYLLKPIDRVSLVGALDAILQRRRLRDEHARLMVENLEFMGVLSLYERGLGLFATLALEPLAERIIEALCLETRAQGGVLWVGPDAGATRLRLMAARGLVRVDEEREEIDLETLSTALAAVAREGVRSALLPQRDAAGGEADALFVPLHHAGACVGLARLTDRLEGAAFGDRDRSAAEKFAELGGLAVANAQRFRSLERRSFKDPTTRAYTLAYFDDVVRNEIQKANRFARSFSVLKLELAPLDRLRRRLSDVDLGRWLEAVVFQVSRSLRSTDLVASESDDRYRVLLPETDALGAVALKRRIRAALEPSDVLARLDAADRPRLLIAAASFPGDGTQLETLARVLDARLEEERGSLVGELADESASFGDLVGALLARARPDRGDRLEQVGRFLLDEVGRRPRDRGLLFLAPGGRLSRRLREGVERLHGLSPRTEVVLVSDEADAVAGAPVTCMSSRRTGTRAPFVIYYGEGPAYALVRERVEGPKGTALFHTSDRALVEQLAFQLQSELGISLAAA